VDEVEILTARDVPLGGPRAMTVRRTLPQRARSLIGAWCFVDHYGPDDIATTGGMDVPPHPHTGLQTVSWLFTGEIQHRDTVGVVATVRPGELNLMTAGHGVAHSEVSTADTTVLHGIQLWVALPAAARGVPRDFRHHVPEAVEVDGVTVRVLLGTLAGSTSPVPTHSPLLGAELRLPPAASVTFDVDPAFEHGLLVDTGDDVRLEGTALERAQLGYLAPGRDRLTVTIDGPEPARALLLGGTPYDDDLVMWWNFVGGSHDEVVQAREEWERESDRFGRVEGYDGGTQRLPAPPLPGVRLKPRELHPAATDASAWG
jgi:redox-sensitive bicupin YhaK (pirin superfamily)